MSRRSTSSQTFIIIHKENLTSSYQIYQFISNLVPPQKYVNKNQPIFAWRKKKKTNKLLDFLTIYKYHKLKPFLLENFFVHKTWFLYTTLSVISVIPESFKNAQRQKQNARSSPNPKHRPKCQSWSLCKEMIRNYKVIRKVTETIGPKGLL